MRTPTSFEQVITILEQQGFTADQISHMCSHLMENSLSMLYSSAVQRFTEEDFAVIDACKSKGEANRKMFEIYKLRTGKNAYDDMDTLIEKFATEFITLHGNR